MGIVQVVALSSPNLVATKTPTYQTAASDTSNTDTYTFSAQAIGTAAADRRVHVGVCGFVGTGTLSGVSIGGIAADINVLSKSGDVTTAIVTALVPTGTTADIIVSFGSNRASCHIGVWSSVGVTATNSFDTDTSSVDPGTATLSTLSGGFVIGVAGVAGSATTTWTNATETFDQTDAESKSSTGASAATTGADVSPSGDYSAAGTSRQAVFATF